MSKSPKRCASNVALIDMDGTVADYEGQLIADLSRMRAPCEPEITPRNLWKDIPHLEERIKAIRRQSGWWASLPPIQVSLDIVQMMYEMGFEVHVLTKEPMLTALAWTEKVEWCKRYLPYALPTITQDKSLVYGKILFDDYHDYMLPWLDARPRGLGLMLSSESNKRFRHRRVMKVPRRAGKKFFARLKEVLEQVMDREGREELKVNLR